MAIIAESQTPEVLTRRLIDGTLDVAIMLEPAQLDCDIPRTITKIKTYREKFAAGQARLTFCRARANPFLSNSLQQAT